jgi:signal transduction histidine kinase
MDEQRSASRGRSRIAWCRTLLSAVVLWVALPMHWEAGGGGPLPDVPGALLVIYFVYSLATASFLWVRPFALPAMVWRLAPWIDVGFATAVAAVVPWERAPVFVLYLFALLVAAFHGSRATAFAVSGASVALYLFLALVQAGMVPTVLAARAACLGILAYAVTYVVQLRLDLERAVTQIELTAERTRIARTLHDSCVQALTAVDLQLEGCRGVLRRGDYESLESHLQSLQTNVRREHDTLRSYVRRLAGASEEASRPRFRERPAVSVRADFNGSAEVVQALLHILHEGLANVCQHARAKSAAVAIRDQDGGIVMTLDDDGVGLPNGATPPWSIASRVRDLGGCLEVRDDVVPGAHLVVTLPRG